MAWLGLAWLFFSPGSPLPRALPWSTQPRPHPHPPLPRISARAERGNFPKLRPERGHKGPYRAVRGRAPPQAGGGPGEERGGVGPGRAEPSATGGAAAPDTPGRERGGGGRELCCLRKPLPAVSQRWSRCSSRPPLLLLGAGLSLLFPSGLAAAHPSPPHLPPPPSPWSLWLRPAAAWRRCASRC